MNSVDRREIWLDCLIVAIVVSLIFLLIVSNHFMTWFEEQIPDVKYRTLSAAGLIFIVVYICVAIILNRREQKHRCNDDLLFPHDLDESMDDICNYISTGLWANQTDWMDKLTLRYVW